MSLTMLEFGRYIASLREKAGYKSQRKLYEASGVSNATINRIESGEQKANPETLERLAPYLRVTYDELMEKAGYIQEKKSADTLVNQEVDFLEWVRDNMGDVFFYDFDSAPEERKEQLMKDFRYLWERDTNRYKK